MINYSKALDQPWSLLFGFQWGVLFPMNVASEVVVLESHVVKCSMEIFMHKDFRSLVICIYYSIYIQLHTASYSIQLLLHIPQPSAAKFVDQLPASSTHWADALQPAHDFTENTNMFIIVDRNTEPINIHKDFRSFTGFIPTIEEKSSWNSL